VDRPEEFPHDPELIPNWFDGPDDEVDDAERRRRRVHIENVHIGEWLIVTSPGHPMIGHPIVVKGIAAPIILCHDQVHDVLHTVDIRQHTFSSADSQYVRAFQEVANRKMRKVQDNVSRLRARAGGGPVNLTDIIGSPPSPDPGGPTPPPEEPPQCPTPPFNP
jgi:hypothetical protein